MDISTYVKLDTNARTLARGAATNALIDLYLAEAAIQLRRFEPAAHQVRLRIDGLMPGMRLVDLVRIEDASGTKVRRPRQGLVEKVEGLLGAAARLDVSWRVDEEFVVVLPATEQEAAPVEDLGEPAGVGAGSNG